MSQLLLEINFPLTDYKFGILAFVTAFIVSLILMIPLIKLIHRFKLFDVPDIRKEHVAPVPTMGGIASCLGMAVGCALWYTFTKDIFIIAFFFSIAILFIVGILDDLHNMPARAKLVIQLAVASLIAFSGVRITSFNGLFGIWELPITAQYTFTVLAIAGITNAFNLIDGIDGLAGGLGFMSLITLGLFLTLTGEANTAIIAFAMAGGLLGFLYYNFNPARIFMGDTGSLVLGFLVSVLCVRLIQLNTAVPGGIIRHVPIFALSLVAIPVFDTLRVFALRIWSGRSPFTPGKDHIHHLLSNNGWSHRFTAKMISIVHGIVLVLGYFLKEIRQEWGLLVLLAVMLVVVAIFQRMKPPQAGSSISFDAGA
jgi:UDP-N-acetylmuramyl pentapeptide phosphotransferase/UDP-N-acetylglucosamine-1-phosphate transferase